MYKRENIENYWRWFMKRSMTTPHSSPKGRYPAKTWGWLNNILNPRKKKYRSRPGEKADPEKCRSETEKHSKGSPCKGQTLLDIPTREAAPGPWPFVLYGRSPFLHVVDHQIDPELSVREGGDIGAQKRCQKI